MAKNYCVITLTSIGAKIYNDLLRHRIGPKIEKILRKNQNRFQRNRSTFSIFTTPRHFDCSSNSRRCSCKKKLEAILLLVDFSKAFNRRKMEPILLAFDVPKETVAAIRMQYKNTKLKVCSPDEDTDYFDIEVGPLQGDTFAPYLSIIRLDYVLSTSIDLMKENSFKLAKERRQYPT